MGCTVSRDNTKMMLMEENSMNEHAENGTNGNGEGASNGNVSTGHVVVVLGGGGREHALCWKLSQSPQVSKTIHYFFT